MGYLSCNAESAIATCDLYNWDLTKKKQRRTRDKPNKKAFNIREFSYLDLQTATNGFSPDSFLGKGSHGSVYKAVLDDGKLIAAVKKTTAISNPSNNKFSNRNNCTNSPAENEIETLSRIRNPRLVNLLGFGVDSNERKLIVVEFMPNGSLYDLLHTATRPPGWARRVRFSLQIAKAVQHLHLSNPPVIHRDIKSSNVLLDDDWNARIGDFGLALRGHVEDVRFKCTPPAGTLGYLDPGYLAPGDLSTKSDVFSFGILLLEIVSGRNAIDMNYSPPSVVDWAAPLIRGCDFAGICDPRIGPPSDPAVIRQLAVLAARCVRSTAEKRPAMSDVVDCLSVVNKRVAASPIWNKLGRRVRKSSPSRKYEPLDYSTEIIRTLRMGSRRNRKVSSVPGAELGSEAIGSNNDRVARSKSIGSVCEIKMAPSDSNLGGNKHPLVKRRAGLAVKVPIVRLSKSRSMGVLPSTRLVHSNGIVLPLVKNPNVGELESSKLLMHLLKERERERERERELILI
uniref:Protein kinase domain-containing protein n=1 Tax=Davidia involucrata TaxID=16924 RepID=A0A5B7AMG9_DAVIN